MNSDDRYVYRDSWTWKYTKYIQTTHARYVRCLYMRMLTDKQFGERNKSSLCVYDIHEKSCLTVKGRPQRKLPSSKSTSVFLLCVILMFLCLKLFEPHLRRQLLTLAFEACVLQSLICSFPPFMFRLKKRKKKKVKSPPLLLIFH